MTEDTFFVLMIVMIGVTSCVAAVAWIEHRDATGTRNCLRAFAFAIRDELKRQPDETVRPNIERIADMMEEAAE